MKHSKLILFLLFLMSIKLFSQEIPEIKIGKKNITINRLSVDVRVVGDIAITTYDMQFYNPENRVLEGELSFPLGENQSVIRFALEINGNLREAVVVEKEKARVAFETTVRNKIDPALLERTKGNNYKARVYPIPAKGYKRVVIAYQQKLLVSKNSYYYKLPFNFKRRLEQFSLSVKVFNQKNRPIFKDGFSQEFEFDSENNLYYAKVKKSKTRVTKPVLLKIPLSVRKEKILAYNNYFYFTKQLSVIDNKCDLEDDITIFWDNSLSQKNKKIDTELDLLDGYFKSLKKCKVTLVVFNIKIQKKKSFTIVDGDWNTLKKYLKNIIYDGASSFDFLTNYSDNSKLNLVFTDGLNTLSDLKLKFKKKTHIVNSSKSANHILLKKSANNIGGYYFNLQQTSIKNVLKKLTINPLRIIGTNLSIKQLEIYPKVGDVVNADFSVSGKGDFFNKKVEIYLGYGNNTVKTVTFLVKKESGFTTEIPKIWAQNKLNSLLVEQEDNKEEILKISKKYQLISPFTSLLILDRVEDYVTHEIVPPKELKKQYDELVAFRNVTEKEEIKTLQNELLSNYSNLFSWFNIKYSDTQKENIISLGEALKKTDTLLSSPDTISNEATQTGKFVLSGVVKDLNEVLPGAQVLIKQFRAGVQTDFDGRFSISVATGDVLQFSFIGYKTVEKRISTERMITIIMEEDNAALDEAVVTAYGIKKVNVASGYAVSRISSESLEGSVKGVTVFEASENKVSLNTPLYIVDGVIAFGKPKLKASEIYSMYTLSEDEGEKIYGDKAKNGIVVYITQKGFDNELKEIEEFEDLVKEKVELKGWNPKTPYLDVLNKIEDINEAYRKYIELREKYNTSPSFYIDVADYFKEKKD